MPRARIAMHSIQEIQMAAPGLGTPHPQRFLLPVQIVQLQSADLAGSQAVGA